MQFLWYFSIFNSSLRINFFIFIYFIFLTYLQKAYLQKITRTQTFFGWASNIPEFERSHEEYQRGRVGPGFRIYYPLRALSVESARK